MGLSRLRPLAAITAALALVLAGCGGAKVGDTSSSASGGASSASCGTFNLAVNPWVGYEADAAVVAYLAKTKLGCDVKEQNITEQVSWQGFASGQVDAILENWGHPDLKTQYIDNEKVAQDAGSDGLQGVIGWYVPPWMAQQYPDITDWHNLNKYAQLFKTSESGDQGQLLDGDPSYVTNDAALVKNLNLNYKVVQGGSETALIQSFRSAQQNKTALLAYFYSPQWFFNEVPLVKVNLPPYTPGCDSDPQKVACDYPPYALDKIVSTKFTDSHSPAYTLVKNFSWTNEEQNEVARSIAVDKLSDDAAAKKFLDAHPELVSKWLAGTGKS
ncbi:MAG TPA: ABC transporter substrate-binding protein [Amycolatopsis sp.]|jgi:glycine betaine/proline transport system substrate-binding protein|nr:ABC transporter substrate-binding protein [Amycolatopsis sp.]